jgi:hypothetical protein
MLCERIMSHSVSACRMSAAQKFQSRINPKPEDNSTKSSIFHPSQHANPVQQEVTGMACQYAPAIN